MSSPDSGPAGRRRQGWRPFGVRRGIAALVSFIGKRRGSDGEKNNPKRRFLAALQKRGLARLPGERREPLSPAPNPPQLAPPRRDTGARGRGSLFWPVSLTRRSP